MLSGAPVVGRPAELGQLGGEMAHRGKKQLNPLFLRPDMDRLLAHLGYPKAVRARVEPPEQAGITIELIPQYQAEMAHAHFGAAARQAWKRSGSKSASRSLSNTGSLLRVSNSGSLSSFWMK